MKGWSMKHIEKLVSGGKATIIQPVEPPADFQRESKYRNKKCLVDGIPFDSKKEADRYRQLLWQQKLGIIGPITRQVEYELNPGGSFSIKYISDFEYTILATGEHVVEDVKGYRTREYKKKRRLMKKVHNIKIKEV